MISVSTTLAGQDLIRQLVPLMANPFWYATPENEWEDVSQIPAEKFIDKRGIMIPNYKIFGTN